MQKLNSVDQTHLVLQDGTTATKMQMAQSVTGFTGDSQTTLPLGQGLSQVSTSSQSEIKPQGVCKSPQIYRWLSREYQLYFGLSSGHCVPTYLSP